LQKITFINSTGRLYDSPMEERRKIETEEVEAQL